jgi:triphosphoribosyl-dephospho-CoA synthase
MSFQDRVAEAFISSCRDEILALKPGNVHIHASGHGMKVEHFLVSAAAAALPLTQPGLRVGQRIRGAVEASFSAAGLNTNLGILLLCAPLAAAAELVSEPGMQDFRFALIGILNGLDRQDAEETFQAIAHASPGGLGDAAQHDVHRPAMVSLSQAMTEAAPRDRIALQYDSNFEDIFTTGLTALTQARVRHIDPPWTTVAIYLAFLSKFPDTHIARKFGLEIAEKVKLEAKVALAGFEAKASPDESFDDLMALDTSLKARGYNPGTSADMTVATLFADRLSSILLQPRING